MRLGTAEKKPAQTSFDVGKEEVEREAKAPASAAGTDLALIPPLQTIVPAEFFKPNGSDALLAAIEAKARAMVAQFDISTETGRKGIASVAYQVACSKTPLDDLGEALIVESRAFVALVNAGRKTVRERLDAIKTEIRRPLTDYEAANATRIAAHEAELKAIVDIEFMASTRDVARIKASIAAVKEKANRPWEEFKSRADLTISGALERMDETLGKAERAEEEAAELKRLRREEAERKERDRLQAIADEATAAERRRAEAAAEESRRAAEAERLRIEAERNEAAAKAQQAEAERVAAEERAAQAARDAEEQRRRDAEFAEQKRIAREQEIERERKAAADKAERDAQAAVEAERKRVAAEAERVRVETEKRERNKKHRERIEAAAAEGLIFRFPMQIELARDLIKAISEGLIPNVTINY